MGRRIGLLGGTFDPPHLGHLVLAEAARVSLHLDEVRLLVAGDPWMKQVATPSEVRVRLARAAVDGDRHLRVDDREVRRAGPTYTVDTLQELSSMEPDASWWFILGQDAANALADWQRVDELLALATFIVAGRPGHGSQLGRGLARQLTHIEAPMIDISSSDLRARYRSGAATRYLVPDDVDRLVRRLELYRGEVPGPDPGDPGR